MPRKKPEAAKHPQALRDIIEHADYLARVSGFAIARRFLASTEQTINRLAKMPGMGRLWDSENPKLSEVRFFPISKFRNHLVFYRPNGGGIEVVRVLHGARDIEALFSDED